MEKGLTKNNNGKEYFRKYFLRILGIYSIWTILTLHISWMTITIAHGDYSWWMKCIYLIREFLFSGSLGIYWYLLCLLYCSVIIYMALHYRCLLITMVAATLLFLIGIIMNTGIGWETAYGKITHIVFGSTRNPFNEGLFYMLLGFLISKHTIQIEKKYAIVCLFLSFIISLFLWINTNIQIMQLFSALSIFMWVKEIDASQHINTGLALYCRKLSTAIYLLQFPFILLFDFHLHRGTLIEFPVTIIFCVLVYSGSKLLLPQKWIKLIYG